MVAIVEEIEQPLDCVRCGNQVTELSVMPSIS